MQNFLCQVKQTSFGEVRPRYVVLIDENESDKKVLSQKFYSNYNWSFELSPIREGVYYTYCSANLVPFTKVLKEKLKHSNFIVTEIGMSPEHM